MDLSNSSAVVTGGAGGLGGAAVRRLVAEGVFVVVADLADDRGAALVAELGEDKAAYVRTDVTDEDSVRAALARSTQKQPLRTVVAAHGGPVAQMRVLGRDGTPMPQALFERTVSLYLSGTFNVLRLAAEAMAKNEPLDSGVRGLVVNTASIAAYEGQVGQSDYSAAKGGVVGLTLVAARDLSTVGIRVCSIAPGTFYTPNFGPEDEAQQQWGSTVPFPKRMGKAAEYGDLVAFLAKNDYVNGETIRIDGAQRFGLK